MSFVDERRRLMMATLESAGLKCLASGRYTTESSVTNMTIPVTYQGEPLVAFMSAVDPPADTAQSVAAFYMLQAAIPDDVDTYYRNGFAGYITRTTSNTYSNNVVGRSNTGTTFAINSNSLFFGRPSPSSPWQPNTSYDWCIYGK